MNIVLTGGGTGGHIYPAIAVAQALKQDEDIKNIYYIGCDKKPEKEIAEQEGLEFYSVLVSGMPRKLGIGLFFWFIELVTATIGAFYHLKGLKPDVVFGTGGYVTAPVLMAALILGIPYVIHDPDAYPGIVNRVMSRWAKTVSTAFEQAKQHLKGRNIKVYGNPVRSTLLNISKPNALSALGLDSNKKTILAIGGSQGAQTINNAIRDAAPILIEQYGFQVIHQTGKKNYEEFIKTITREYPEYIVKPYFDDMALPLNAADIAISRAGSLSISELNLCGLPSILVPYPYAAADHQRFNARAMESAGACVYLEDVDCNAEKLVELITVIDIGPMQEANKALAKPDAVKDIINEIKSC